MTCRFRSAVAFAVFLPAAALQAQAPPRPEPGAAAAGRGSIHGVVLAADGGRPLAGAAVTLRPAADSAVVATGLTSATGAFLLRGLPEGRYGARIQLLGFRTLEVAVTVAGADLAVDLGALRLAAAPVALEGVEVRAERAALTLASDRSVYGTKDMPVAAGGTATDVLRHVPELDVDVDGNVSLRGSSGVTLQINGRPAPVRGDALGQFLQQFPASRIARVEVIPNPSARFDPEGTAGIVNIVLKEDMDLGWSGSLTGTSGTRGGGGSARLAYQRGALTLSGGAAGNLSANTGSSQNFRENLLTRPVTYLSTNAGTRSHGRFGTLDLSGELRLGARETVWLTASAFRNGYDTDGTTAYALLDADRAPLDRYDRESTFGGGDASGDVAFGIRRVVQPQRDELSLEVRRTSGRQDLDSRSLRDPYDMGGFAATSAEELTTDTGSTDDATTTVQLDWVRPLGGAYRLEAGYRGSLRESEEAHQVRSYLPAAAVAATASMPSTFLYRERFHSAYLTLGRQAGKLSVQVGGRAERAATTLRLPLRGERHDDDYFSFYPSANLAWDFAAGRQLRLTYSKRIDRPFPFFLNPEHPTPDPLNRFVGNPDLEPKYTHSVGLDLSWTGARGALRLSPYYRRTVDNWEQVKTVDSVGISTVTWQNLAAVEAYGSTLTASLPPARRLGGFLALGAFRQVREVGPLAQGVSGAALRWTANTSLTFQATSVLDLQGMLRYSPPQDLAQGHISGMVVSSLGARRRLWGTKGALSLSLMDPFNLWRYEIVTHDSTHVQSSRNTWSMRVARLSLSYTFGRPPTSTRRRPSDTAQSAEPEIQIH